MPPPVGVSMKGFCHQADILGIPYSYGNNGKIARYTVGPEPGLAKFVLDYTVLGGSELGTGVDQVAGDVLEPSRLFGLYPQVAQLQLGTAPGQFQFPCHHRPSGVFAQ